MPIKRYAPEQIIVLNRVNETSDTNLECGPNNGGRSGPLHQYHKRLRCFK